MSSSPPEERTKPQPSDDDDFCKCSVPVLDSDLPDVDGEDDDWCWRCKRPVRD